MNYHTDMHLWFARCGCEIERQIEIKCQRRAEVYRQTTRCCVCMLSNAIDHDTLWRDSSSPLQIMDLKNRPRK